MKKLVFKNIIRNCVVILIVIMFSNNYSFGQNRSDGPPNFVIIFVDDFGYGDLSCYGNPTIITPNLDKMATEGQKWTNFYVGASVCTPSRAALLTGRLPVRNGMTSNKARVLDSDSPGGLPPEEITLAEQLKKADYSTACIGKWHLGTTHTKYLPTSNGFDYYFGIPYSNDMDRIIATPTREKYKEFWEDPKNIRIENFNVPLMRNTEIIERPADQHTITKRYTQEAISYIKKSKDKPFFLYLAHNLPHVPLFASKEFLGTSKRGLYGDVVQEIDYGVGQIIKTLKEEGLADNTIVVFTSDNGPWLSFGLMGGSAGLLKGGKGMTWEGGMREPCIIWSPKKIKPAIITDLGTTMDLFTTFSKMAGVSIPNDRIIDGLDLTGTLLKSEPSPRENVFYYRGTDLFAVRLGDYKAHYITEGSYGQFGGREEHNPPLLYNLSEDPSEKFNIADKHPDIIQKINDVVKKHQSKLVKGKDQLVGHLGHE